MDLISRGSDVQIEEADNDDDEMVLKPGVREAGARNQQSVIEQADPAQSLDIQNDYHDGG